MSDSDSDSNCDWRGSEEDKRHEIAFLDHNITIVNPKAPLMSPDEVFENWGQISDQEKRKSGHMMKICAFWLPLLLQRDETSTVSHWASQVGLVEPYKDLNLRHIYKIEILEAILRALVQGTLKKTQTKQVVWISNRFYMHSPEVLENALQWLERTGEPDIRQRVLEFGHLDICFKALHLIFVEFSQYIKAMALSMEGTMTALGARPADMLIRRSEEMKRKGNEHFQKRLYEEAVKFYSKALKYYPDNHIIYGNRALCYIKSNNYLKALGDGKRATLIKPLWAKGHYRFCEALFGLGQVRLALEANSSAQSLCKEDPEGIKDLENQHLKFSTQVTNGMHQVPGPFSAPPKRSTSQRPSQTKEASPPQPHSPKPKQKKATPVKSSKEPEPKVEKKPANNKTNKTTSSAAQNGPSEPKPAKSEKQSVQKSAPESVQKKVEAAMKPKENPKSAQNEQKKGTVDMSNELSAAVRDGHAALENLRSRNAEQAFSRALALAGHGASKVQGVSSIDVLLLQFGRATALTRIGRPEELSEAVQVLDRIQASEERTFQCLVCLAYGRVYVKENRYKTALPHFWDALKIVKNQITPGILTWPLTSHVVPETKTDYLTKILEDSIELCRFPPLPDAVCRIENCISSAKKEIYFTDPDFKGFIQLHCCHSCSVEYHMNCWKSLKTLAFYEKSEKDILQDGCLTPDCRGQINSIKIYGPTGLVKCKFEVAIPRPVAPKKPKVNQNCTSLKKIKSKEERQLRRKSFKQQADDTEAISTEPVHDNSAKTPPRARLHFRDHVLLQISQHLELLRQERGSCVPALSCSLRPWLLLDLGRGCGGNVASRLLQSLEEPAFSLGTAVELVLERRNRVWARLLIQVLSDCVDLQPKISSWAQRLDAAGLSAAQFFLEQHSSDLESLDLSLLLRFSPVQENILEKLGSRPELFSSLGLTVTEYLRQSPPRDVRLFVWALEEHRQHYAACHSLLDHYFDMMDGLCSVLKKSEDDNNIVSSPNKSKHRSKKKKAPKPLLVWSGPRGSPVSDDWGPGLMDDDSLSFLDEPFSVPPHLRQQVVSFEQQFHRSGINYVVEDSEPEYSKDLLYLIFTQILEAHGPLAADDLLLVGELNNLPVSSQLQIEAAGGLEAFLLAGQAFTAVGGCLCLISTDPAPPPAPQSSLDQLDTIDSPPSHSPGFFTFLRDTFPTLPSPYDLYTDHGRCSPHPEPGCDERPEASSAPNRPSHQPQKQSEAKKPELLSVAVNTEALQEYESYQGELNILLKTHKDMRRQMSCVSEDRDKLQQQRGQELKALEEELSLASTSVQVTQQELSMFQHKLEEEVKKDQKDKKEHQEQIKALKQEQEALQHEKNRMKKSIKEKNVEYEARLRDFLELSNQSAAERMSLEEELKRCDDTVARASRRSLAAQMAMLKSSWEQSLYSLHRELADNRAVLRRLTDVSPRFSGPDTDAAQDKLRAGLQDIEKKISSTQAQYEQQMKELRSGSSDPRPVSEARSADTTPEQAPAPRAPTPQTPRAPTPQTPIPRAPTPQAPAPQANRDQASPQSPAGGAAAAVKKKTKTRRAVEVTAPTVFERAVERLSAIFPHISRSELTALIQRLRSSSGSLLSLSLQDVVGGVSQLILDQQEEQDRARVTPPLGNSASAWLPLEPHRSAHVDALNTEDPCIICHEDMSTADMCVLECRHSFHNECIRSWLKEQSTCPTCRDHTLLLEDFPALSMSTRRH